MSINPLDCDDFYITYKKRYPDPGKCRVLAINWEDRTLEVTNGAVRLWPDFDEVKMVEEVTTISGGDDNAD